MNETAWQIAHRAEVTKRLAALSRMPDGMLYEQVSNLHHIRLLKQAGQIQFYFVAPDSGELDGPMSRIAIEHPFALLADYTQSVLLALLWQSQPKRVCMLGMAGGCVSLLLYHIFPACQIDNVDIDPAVPSLAQDYFGLTFDQRQTITISDARSYLAALPAQHSYDIIVMDAFGDASQHLLHLATVEFYRLCQQHMARSSVFCVNMLTSEPQFYTKLKTFVHCFRHVLCVELKYGIVLFGTNQTSLNALAIQRRAEQIQRMHGFEFPFLDRAAALHPVNANAEYQAHALREVPLLYDQP